MKILFLDDNPNRRNKFKTNAIGCHVDFATTAQQCLELLQISIQENQKYDLVCLDHDLGGPESENNPIQDPQNNGMFVVERLTTPYYYNVYKDTSIIIHSLNHKGASNMYERLRTVHYKEVHRIIMAWARFAKTDDGGYRFAEINSDIDPKELSIAN